MTPEEILHTAIEIIERDGWYQGDLDDGDDKHGAVCAVGAIERAWSGSSQAFGALYWPDERREAIDRLNSHVGSYYGGIGVWNDHPGRTVEDVILALKKAAAS
ncbi:hypothetical protein ACFY7C_19360 [Streptomyces sp. NPDC012769]|uniref:DUF6197 family protein n=1 Tax=Streptomyces sp. NPDC012769 TaxID=3364848 RepID=UPI00368801CB